MNRILCFFFLLSLLGPAESYAQGIPALKFDLKKPEKFENKKLGSEKTGDKKFTLPRRFIQNTVTKFNWNFNAEQKLAQVLERAKLMHKDDYTELLSFYNYSLDATAGQKTELDSVIYKANAGILLHDLRNSWIDNLYMLMGQAYYFRKEFDTAYLTFQYINYAFSPKEKDGYDKPIGSNANEGGNAFSISTRENNNIANRIWRRAPSRNESFIWQIRNYIAQDAYAEAAGLIETLRHDPLFPERLQTELNEMRALWFYKQDYYDSAAVYLDKALPDAQGREETARWEYLIAQLYEKAGNHNEAKFFYEKAVRRTLNPVLEVYGRLNAIRQNRSNEKSLEDNLEALRKMARKDRYSNYRDIIYYAAAQMEMERKDTAAAMAFLLKSTRVDVGIHPGDPLQKSRSFLQLADLSFAKGRYPDAKRFYDSVNNQAVVKDSAQFASRKQALTDIAKFAAVVDRQDSLQRLASMPDADREKFIRKLLRQLRKQRGLKEEEPTAGSVNPSDLDPNAMPDLFGNSAKGEWYFYNNDLKTKGLAQFRAKWGNRPNVDNWQRISAVKAAVAKNAANQSGVPGKPTALAAAPVVLSYDALLSNVPLTPEKMKASNDSIETAQAALGDALLNGLEDYAGAARAYEKFLDRFPESHLKPEVLLHLYYCYRKLGESEKAAQVLKELQEKFPDSEYTERASHPSAAPAEDSLKEDMTRAYEHIYNLFIEGRFDEAMAAKSAADSLYSSNYWTPQLLYIQSVYLIKQHQDDSAKLVLSSIMKLYAGSPMAERAKIMIDVLGRRKQIEKHLEDLKIERPEEKQAGPVTGQPGSDSTQQQPVTAGQQRAKQVISAAPAKPGADTAQGKAATKVVKPYSLNPDAPHAVVILLNKVDPVFVTEARNAFDRFNKQNYYNKPMTATLDAVNDSVKLVLINPFANAKDALDYMEKTRKIANSSIVPWLPANKFSFMIISLENLDLLKQNGEISGYRSFLSTAFPGKFE